MAGIQINVLLYADDLVILSESKGNLQLMINRLSSYCEKWGLEINSEKSKIMIFSRSNRIEAEANWWINGRRLEVTNTYRYLGVNLNPTLNFSKHLVEKAKASQSLINLTWKNIFSNNHIHLSTKYQIFNSVVKSTLCYAAQIWGMEEYEETEKLQRSFIKKNFNLPTNTPNYAIYLETGLPKIFTSTLKLQADYLIKVLGFRNERLSKKMLLYEVRNKDWWFDKWQRIATSFGEDIQIDPNNILGVKEKLYKIIQLSEDSVRNLLVETATESQSRILYSQLKFNLSNNNYFHDYLSPKDISLIFKARCELLCLNGRPYNGSYNQFCTLCNTRSKEDCFHFISICPIFRHKRFAYFGKFSLSMQETIQILDGADWTKLVNYLKEICRFRKLLVTEYD